MALSISHADTEADQNNAQTIEIRIEGGSWRGALGSGAVTCVEDVELWNIVVNGKWGS